MGCSSSKARANEQLAKTILQARKLLKPEQYPGPSACSGAVPPDETSSLLESGHVNDTDASAESEAHDERQWNSSNGEETNEEDGGEDPKYVTIDLNSPDDFGFDVIRRKMLGALKQSGLNRFDLACFDFHTFDVQIGFYDLESFTDQSGTSYTSEQLASSLEHGENVGVMFPISARMKIKRASGEKLFEPSELNRISMVVNDVGSYREESCDDIITSVTFRRLLRGLQTSYSYKSAFVNIFFNFALNSHPAGKDALLATGCLQAVIQCMHEGDDGINSWGCAFLYYFCVDSTKRVEAVANAGAGAILPRILATDRWDGPYFRRICVSCIAMFAEVSSDVREEMAEVGVMSALLTSAAHHSDTFEKCAIALSFYASEVVEEKRIGLPQIERFELEEGIRMDQVATAAAGMRYG